MTSQSQRHMSWRAVLPLIAAGFALLASACSATTSSAVSARLDAGPVTAPPRGAFEFCVREPAVCGLETSTLVKAELSEEATAGGAKSSPSTDAVMVDPPMRAAAPSWDDDALLLALAATVNDQVNGALDYVADIDVWGREEAWAMPLSRDGGNEGDCEDYALEKRALLLEAGVSSRRLLLATAWSRETGNHAVLILRAAGGDYVLDNAEPRLRRVNDTPYRWTAIQTGEHFLSWAQVRVSQASVMSAT